MAVVWPAKRPRHGQRHCYSTSGVQFTTGRQVRSASPWNPEQPGRKLGRAGGTTDLARNRPVAVTRSDVVPSYSYAGMSWAKSSLNEPALRHDKANQTRKKKRRNDGGCGSLGDGRAVGARRWSDPRAARLLLLELRLRGRGKARGSSRVGDTAAVAAAAEETAPAAAAVASNPVHLQRQSKVL